MTTPSNEQENVVLAASADQILRFRRHRDRVFNLTLFSDPAWDILLEIFRSAVRGTAITVSDTASGTGIASSSATRWVRTLETAGFVSRNPDPADKRRVLLDITPMGRALMKRTLDKWLLEDKAVSAPPRRDRSTPERESNRGLATTAQHGRLRSAYRPACADRKVSQRVSEGTAIERGDRAVVPD